MTYNVTGKRIRTENLAGQVTTTAWDGWSVTYNGENCPVLWENVSTNSPTPNSSTPPLISMFFNRMGRRVTKNDSASFITARDIVVPELEKCLKKEGECAK